MASNQFYNGFCMFMVLLALASLVGCGSAASAEVARSDKPRQTAPTVADEDLARLVQGNTAFAFAMYHALRSADDNLFFSPYSISQALAMTYAGAQASTAQQMADALHFTLPPEQLHPASNALALQLARYGEAAPNAQKQPFQLTVANALWGQSGFPFRQAFLDTLAEHYAAGMQLKDFQAGPDAARTEINAWVAEQTNDKIQDLLPEGAVDASTRLVLTNAIYFNAKWRSPFEPSSTRPFTFTLLDGNTVSVPMMHDTKNVLYAENNQYQAVELPYAVPGAAGGLSMLVLLPKEGQFDAFEQSLNGERIDEIADALSQKTVELTLPKWTFTSQSVSLKNILSDLGMPIAFDANLADFGGMADLQQVNGNLYIDNVYHKAFVAVDEAGTEAAAATGAVMGLTSAMMSEAHMRVDRPFVFLIRDTQSGTVLFVGRVLDPR